MTEKADHQTCVLSNDTINSILLFSYHYNREQYILVFSILQYICSMNFKCIMGIRKVVVFFELRFMLWIDGNLKSTNSALSNIEKSFRPERVPKRLPPILFTVYCLRWHNLIGSRSDIFHFSLLLCEKFYCRLVHFFRIHMRCVSYFV